MKFKSFLKSLLTVFALSFVTIGCDDDDAVVTPDVNPDPEQPVMELTFELDVQHVTAQGADLTIKPSLDDKTYIADVLPQTLFDNEGESSIIESLEMKVKPEDLMKGTQTINPGAPLKPETEYVFFAAGFENGKLTTKLTKKTFTTLKGEEQPEMPVGPEANGKVTELDAAHFAEWIFDYENDADKEHFLSTLPGIVDFYGPGCGEHLVPIFDQLAEDYKGQINFFRFDFTKPEHKAIREYMGVTLCPTLGFFMQGKEHVMLGDEEANAITTPEMMRTKIEQIFGIKWEGTEPEPQPEEFTKQDGVINELTAAAFRHFVWDYEANPDAIIFKGDKPAIVDCGTEWCGPCQQLHPIFEKLAAEYSGQVDFFYIDADKEPALADVLGVTGFPTLFYFPMEGEALRSEGGISEATLREIIDANLLNKEESYDPSIPGPEMANEYWLGDQDHRYTHMRISANLRCASKDAVEVKVAVYPKEMLDELLLENNLYTIVNRYGQIMEPEVVELINGEGTVVTAQAMQSETRSFIVMAKNAQGGVSIERKDMTTTEDYSEPIDFQAAAADTEGRSILIYVKSGCATEIYVRVMLRTEYNEAVAQGMTTEQLLSDGSAYQFSPEEVATAVSTTGCMIEMTGCTPGTWYECMGMVKDAEGNVYTHQLEIQTQGKAPVNPDDPQVVVGPDMSINLNSWTGGGMLTYSITCNSGDATSGSLLLLDSKGVTEALAQGTTLEDFAANHAEKMELTADDLNYINNGGTAGEFEAGATERYTMILDVSNAQGGRTVKRADHQVNRPNAPELNLYTSTYDVEITCTAQCLSFDATEASITLIETTALEQALNSGTTYEEFMNQNGEVFDADNLSWLNGEGNIFSMDLASLTPATRYTWVLSATNKAGNRTIQRAESITPAGSRSVASPRIVKNVLNRGFVYTKSDVRFEEVFTRTNTIEAPAHLIETIR